MTDAATPAARFLVRHGAMRFLGDFEPAEGVVLRRGDDVVVRT